MESGWVVDKSIPGMSIGWEIGKKNTRYTLNEIGFYCNSNPITNNPGMVSGQDATTHVKPLTSATFRVNIYDSSSKVNDGKLIRDLIGVESIKVDFSSTKLIDGRFTYKFSSPIVLPENSVVEIEMPKSFPDGEGIIYNSNMMGEGTLFRFLNIPNSFSKILDEEAVKRLTETETWVSVPVATPFFITLTEDKF